ncbi:MAG: septum formation initiator family protein [Candidatus Babeliales bacterium]|nr:septum formation initiator family protein [Candidatus Babeliales bacterium]
MNKKNIKKLFLRAILFVEILIFGFTYLFGSNGLYYLKDLDKENHQLNNEVLNLKSEISSIESQINEWSTDPFYKEQLAREKLQLARENEKIFYIQ